jgi:hypothetical protein
VGILPWQGNSFPIGLKRQTDWNPIYIKLEFGKNISKKKPIFASAFAKGKRRRRLVRSA